MPFQLLLLKKKHNKRKKCIYISTPQHYSHVQEEQKNDERTLQHSSKPHGQTCFFYTDITLEDF